MARLRSKVRHGKSEKATLVAVAVAVFSAIKEQQVTALYHVRLELGLKPIQIHMALKPLLWVEVGAHAVRNRSMCGGVGWAGAGVLVAADCSII